MNSNSIRSGVLFISILSVAAGTRGSLADEEREIEKLSIEIALIEKSIADPLAGEKHYARAQTQLQTLRGRADRLIETDGDRDEVSELHKLHDRIIKTLATVDARLPTSRPSAFARSGLPAPKYENQKLLSKSSATLRAAQSALASHLVKSRGDDAGTGALLQSLVLAQEDLAWEAGWPFSGKEAAAFKDAKNALTPDVYLSRIKRGVNNINKQLATEAEFVGRQRSRLFVIHAPQDKSQGAAISKALTAKRGSAAEVWMKATSPFDTKARRDLLGGR